MARPLLVWRWLIAISLAQHSCLSFGVISGPPSTASSPWSRLRRLTTTRLFVRSNTDIDTDTDTGTGTDIDTTADASCLDLINLGIASRSSGDFAKAISLFQTAIEKESTYVNNDNNNDNVNKATPNSNAAAHFQLGTTYRRQSNLLAAAASFRRAIELLSHMPAQPDDDDDDDTPEAKFQLGTVLTSMGYVDEAERIFRDLVFREEQQQQQQQGRRPSRAKIALANVLLDGRGEKVEALDTYRQCCVNEQKSPMALLAGVAADSMGDHAAAEEFYKSGWTTTTNCTTNDDDDDVPEQYKHVDPDTALHLMMSRIRVGDQAGAARLQSRLEEHVSSSADYILSTPVGLNPSMHYFTYDMLQLALENSLLPGGLVLEFGVYHGKTIRMIASHFPNEQVHGFDTFSGIPEDWHYTPSGSYSTHGSLPVAPDTVQYHVGLFSDTLPGFLETHPGVPIRFMNIDCDLYSSTRDVLDSVFDRVVPGTVIVFDEYVMNPHWKEDEYRAFQEAAEKYGWKYEYIGISLVSQQAVVRIV
jgi:tetratricopeptide (TPR) repeat protein